MLDQRRYKEKKPSQDAKKDKVVTKAS